MFGHGDVRFFDRIAPVYDRLMPPASLADLRAGLAFAHRPVERVIDLGGGSGRASLALRRSGVEAAVFDHSPGMLRRAASRRVPAVRADAGRLPVPDGGVDAVVVVDALHHFPDIEGALREAARVLAPGGALVIREFDPGTLRGRAIERFEAAAGMGSTFVRPDELATALAAVGLRGHVVDPGFGYTVVGVKPTESGEAAARSGREADGDERGDADAERGR